MSALLGVYARDLVVVEGHGARLVDASGRSYLDFASGIGVNGLGYGDPQVVEAIRRQAGRLIHASNLYASEEGETLARRLVELSFPAKVFFTNSGTEAVEAAIKFARRAGGSEGRTELVAFEGGFHGRTLGALSITWRERYREPFEPLLPGVSFCPWDDLESLRALVGPRTAAVFLEPVQGEGGIRPAPPEFQRGVAALCRERGALLVADEIQCGLGRTGRLFAHQHAGVVPDVMTLAKPLGGGLPLGAVLLREDLAGALQVGDHGSTFGGNPVALAASLAVLDRLTAPGFLEGVAETATALRAGLDELARRYPKVVVEVRGLGLMLGVVLHGAAGPVVNGLREREVLATKAGDNVLRVLPPLVITREDVSTFLQALEAVWKGGAGATA